MTMRKLFSTALALGLSLLAGCRVPAESPAGGGGRAADTGGPSVELLFTYSSEKQDWVEAVTPAVRASG